MKNKLMKKTELKRQKEVDIPHNQLAQLSRIKEQYNLRTSEDLESE